ncbi:MAG: choice-of-anchor M domain-containing protein [Anaerohalosphaeraceae bacterium]
MKRWMNCFLYAGMMLVFSHAHGALSYTSGHADIGLGFYDGELEFHFHAESAWIGGIPGVSGEFEPDDILIVVPDHAAVLRPDGSEWGFTGTGAGMPVWVLPQHHHHDEGDHDEIPFLGLGTEEIPLGVLLNDTVTLRASSVNGPGHFSLWQMDAFGMPVVYISTFDPASANELTLPAGLHGLQLGIFGSGPV